MAPNPKRKRRRVYPTAAPYSGPPPGATALNGLTLVIPPAPPTRKRPPAPGSLAAGGAYRLRKLPGSVTLPGGGLAYVYAAGPYTVAAAYTGPGPAAPPLAYGPYGPALTVYAPGGGKLPASRGYYLRGGPR